MVYQFRATIPESKIFFRVYEIKGEMTLFKFNAFINDDLGFSPDQMVLYEGYDENGELSSEYGMIDLGDGAMDAVTFDKVIQRGESELRYLFDMRNNRYIRLVLEGEAAFSPLRIYPCLVDEKGQNPDQFRPRFEEEPAVPKLHPFRDPKAAMEEDDLDDEDLDDDEDGAADDDRIFDEEEVYDGDEGKA